MWPRRRVSRRGYFGRLTGNTMPFTRWAVTSLPYVFALVVDGSHAGTGLIVVTSCYSCDYIKGRPWIRLAFAS